MTATDWQDKTATPEMSRLRERLGEIQKIRNALNEIQRAPIGSEQEGMACDAVGDPQGLPSRGVVERADPRWRADCAHDGLVGRLIALWLCANMACNRFAFSPGPVCPGCGMVGKLPLCG